MSATLTELIKAGYDVTRWHTMQCSRPQVLAAHLWGVAMILSRTYDGPPEDFRILIRCALEHDLAESRIGDMPRPARTQDHKDLEGEVSAQMGIIHEEKLSPELRNWLVWADLIEAGLHATREVNVGNQNFTEVMFRICDHLQENKGAIPLPLWQFVRQAGMAP